MADPIKASLSVKYTAVHNSGPRLLSNIRWVVIHSTEGGTAAGAASWFANPDSGGSAHIVVDDLGGYRTLGDSLIPWGAKGAKEKGWHVELTGYARWSRIAWLGRIDTLKRGAYHTAVMLHKRGNIPARWVGPIGLRLGRRGLVTHRDVVKAFGGNHTDPGTGFPKDTFLNLVRRYLEEIEATEGT